MKYATKKPPAISKALSALKISILLHLGIESYAEALGGPAFGAFMVSPSIIRINSCACWRSHAADAVRPKIDARRGARIIKRSVITLESIARSIVIISKESYRRLALAALRRASIFAARPPLACKSIEAISIEGRIARLRRALVKANEPPPAGRKPMY